jgi:hypothetical protein
MMIPMIQFRIQNSELLNESSSARDLMRHDLKATPVNTTSAMFPKVRRGEWPSWDYSGPNGPPEEIPRLTPLEQLANVQNCIEALCQPDCKIKRRGKLILDVGIQRLMRESVADCLGCCQARKWANLALGYGGCEIRTFQSAFQSDQPG